LAKFLNKDLNDEQIRSLVEFSKFDNMKTIKSMDYFQHLNTMKIYKQGSKFFVKGKSGNWRNYFSDEMSAKFDRVINKKLKYNQQPIDYGDES
jgi:hypothetical protein